MKKLREITDHLVSAFALKAGTNNNYFVNEIPNDLQLGSNSQIFSAVMSGLLSIVASGSRGSCIRVTAKAYDHIILLKLKDSNSSDVYEIENAVQKFKPLVERMRGSVHVTNQRMKFTTITLGLPYEN